MNLMQLWFYKTVFHSQDLIITFIPGVVQKLAAILKRISDLGAKRIAVGSLPPLGCVPVITISSGFKQCNYTANMASILHNSILADSVAQLNNESLSTQFEILDLDAAFTTIIQHVQDRKGALSYFLDLVVSSVFQMFTLFSYLGFILWILLFYADKKWGQ